MPHLGDYLGQIIGEITIARIHADLETIRLGELYAAHPLLSKFPVPRFRLPEVELDIPVVMKKADEVDLKRSARGGLDRRSLHDQFMKRLVEEVSRTPIRLNTEQMTNLSNDVQNEIERQELPDEVGVDIHRISDKLVDTSLGHLRMAMGEDDDDEIEAVVKKVEADLRVQSRSDFLKLRTGPPRLHTLVTTREVSEIGRDQTIVRIKMKIVEEAMEWSLVSTDEDGVQNQLLPE